MSVRVSVHAGLARRTAFAAATLIFAAVLVTLAVAVKRTRLPIDPPESAAPSSAQGSAPNPALDEQLLLPIEYLCVSADAHETEWTKALAVRMNGVPEFSVAFGRIDVRTRFFAIEVDHLEKWHEGIGQALHYAKATGLRPALALIIASGERSERTIELLALIDQTAAQNGIRLFLISSRC